MRRARILKAGNVDYIGIEGYNQGDTNLLFEVDEAYDILRKSLEGEKTMKTEIDYKERCKELEAKVEKLENMVADLERNVGAAMGELGLTTITTREASGNYREGMKKHVKIINSAISKDVYDDNKTSDYCVFCAKLRKALGTLGSDVDVVFNPYSKTVTVFCIGGNAYTFPVDTTK